MTKAPTLKTERLVLRQNVQEDFALLHAAMASDHTVYMFGPYSLEDSWQVFAAETGAWALQGIGAWAIETHDGTYLGQLTIQNPAHYPEAEIGWILLPGHEGKGYMAEAARAALNWAREARGFTTLVSYIDPQNVRSLALATRLGAVHDVDAPIPQGESPEDTHVYRHDLTRGAA